MTDRAFLARVERFGQVGSTNDIVRGWLDQGTQEVCVAVADEQLTGRGRSGRTWSAPTGAALLCSIGFRPTWLAPERAWQLPAVVSLAMADAAEEAGHLRDRAVQLKWPNDLVLDHGQVIRKLGGVLGEARALGTPEADLVVGIGVNADWPASAFPAELADAMTSLREAAGRPVDRDELLDAFLSRLEPRVVALRAGHFDVADWIARQLTTGRVVRLEQPDGSIEEARAVGVDVHSGGLVIEDASAPGGERIVTTGEIVRVRVAAGEMPARDL